jgi:hypothetical protein
MSKAYILEGTQKEYLLVIKLEDEKAVHKVIDTLFASRNESMKALATELEKSLNDSVSGGDPSKAGSKNKSKSTNSNNSRRRKAKDS